MFLKNLLLPTILLLASIGLASCGGGGGGQNADVGSELSDNSDIESMVRRVGAQPTNKQVRVPTPIV